MFCHTARQCFWQRDVEVVLDPWFLRRDDFYGLDTGV